MNEKKYGAISSSVDPNEISVTVLALTKMLSGLLVMGGIITVADSTTLLAQVPQIITTVMALVPLAYSLWNSGEALFGLGRKILVALFQRKAA